MAGIILNLRLQYCRKIAEATRLFLLSSFLFIGHLLAQPACGQRTVIFNDNVKTVTMTVGDDTGRLPVMRIGSDDRLRVSFDELSHDYHRYTYSLRHLDADFKNEDGLLVSDYVWTVADEENIEDYEQSMNTSVLYTHYSLTLPNAHVRPLLSGNYELTVWDDNDSDEHRPLFRSYFYVTEDLVNVAAEVTTDTEIDRNASHQQLSLNVSTNGLNLRDASKELKVIALQNNRWDNAVIAPAPTGQTGTSVFWRNCRELIFPACNEYRKFELASTRYSGMHIDNLRFYEPYYHATLMQDFPRRNYLYDEDQNGRFVPLADGSGNADTEADYLWVHFELQQDGIPGDLPVYINGQWSNDWLTAPYRMDYDATRQCYAGQLLLKQGYYSYQYLVDGGNGVGKTDLTEGNYYQTENEYTLLVYYRQTGARYDRLVGWRTGRKSGR